MKDEGILVESLDNIVIWRLKVAIVEQEETYIATQATTEELLGTMFPTRSMQSCYKEEFSWESEVEFRSSQWAVSREFRCAREAEKMALWVQLAVGLWSEDFTYAVIFGVCIIQWDCYRPCVKIRCQKTVSGDCNRLRTLVCVCQWSVKCSSEWCMQVVNKSNSPIHTPSIVTHP
jgi:hypothetical protein